MIKNNDRLMQVFKLIWMGGFLAYQFNRVVDNRTSHIRVFERVMRLHDLSGIKLGVVLLHPMAESVLGQCNHLWI